MSIITVMAVVDLTATRWGDGRDTTHHIGLVILCSRADIANS